MYLYMYWRDDRACEAFDSTKGILSESIPLIQHLGKASRESSRVPHAPDEPDVPTRGEAGQSQLKIRKTMRAARTATADVAPRTERERGFCPGSARERRRGSLREHAADCPRGRPCPDHRSLWIHRQLGRLCLRATWVYRTVSQSSPWSHHRACTRCRDWRTACLLMHNRIATHTWRDPRVLSQRLRA